MTYQQLATKHKKLHTTDCLKNQIVFKKYIIAFNVLMQQFLQPQRPDVKAPTYSIFETQNAQSKAHSTLPCSYEV
jgi:hypothetical protein